MGGFAARIETRFLTWLHGLHQLRRDHDDQFLLFLIVAHCPERRAEDRYVTDIRNLIGCGTNRSAYHATDNKCLTGIEFNQSSIAAILTIVGYSLNDTVVVYDRVREFQRKFRKLPLVDLLDKAINSTLSRTVLTGPTTLFALLALAIFGGEVIQSFVLSMIFGVLVGTYSSIFIAAPILVNLGLKERPETDVEAKDKAADGAAV